MTNWNLVLKESAIKQNRVWVRIASTCNNKCLFCLDSTSQDWTFPSEDSIKKQIRNWIKNWYENRIIISWWEASINPRFSEYIKFAKELWYDRIQTITNGNKFSDEEFCKNVFNAWLQEVTFSFHWHNARLHDFLVGTNGAFNKSLKWLIYIKKYYPKCILNIDIVVNKINIKYLSDIIKFFIKIWIFEFDILQIIPFWRWFDDNKELLFYNIKDNIEYLHKTWQLSKINWMYMWTNRFQVEAFEWYEDLIQDPLKIKSEVMWESNWLFSRFINSKGIQKPSCYWERCNYCFLKQYCHDYIENIKKEKLVKKDNYIIIPWEDFPSEIYKKYWVSDIEFKLKLKNLKKTWKKLINIPKCLGWEWIFQSYNDIKEKVTLEDYTTKYIKELYKIKSLKCEKCIYNKLCEWIHVNFIRSYWFNILQPKTK